MRSSWTSSGSSSVDRVAPGHARAAQRGLDAAAELAQRERLGDVVVGAELEAEDLVDLLGLGREHDDRDGAARPQAPADLEPVEPRHHHVEHDEVEGRLAEARQRLAAVDRLHDLVAVLAQRIAEQRLDRLLVVDQQDAGWAVDHLPSRYQGTHSYPPGLDARPAPLPGGARAGAARGDRLRLLAAGPAAPARHDARARRLPGAARPRAAVARRGLPAAPRRATPPTRRSRAASPTRLRAMRSRRTRCPRRASRARRSTASARSRR